MKVFTSVVEAVGSICWGLVLTEAQGGLGVVWDTCIIACALWFLHLCGESRLATSPNTTVGIL